MKYYHPSSKYRNVNIRHRFHILLLCFDEFYAKKREISMVTKKIKITNINSIILRHQSYPCIYKMEHIKKHTRRDRHQDVIYFFRYINQIADTGYEKKNNIKKNIPKLFQIFFGELK